ncbi:MAG: STAS domain-containing protein [Planctomycetales bacterium]|nr:STAS domain-containing protein [Planctomycetales bacterium]
MIVDFHQVPYFGSSLLEVLLSIWSQEQLRAGTMSLCNVSAAGREVLEVTRFDTLWTIYNTRAEALEAAAAG